MPRCKCIFNELSKSVAKNNSTLIEMSKKVESGELLLLEHADYSNPKRSRAWSVFTKLQDKNGKRLRNFIFCTCCRRVFNFMGTTTGLVKHKCFQNFIKKDAGVSNVEKERQEISIVELENTVSIIEEEKPKITDIKKVFTAVTADNLTSLITKWMIKKCQSFELLQSEGLKAVFYELAVLGSTFGDDIKVANFLPSLPEARKNLSETYEQCFERVKAEMALIKEHGFGLTSHIWTDNFTTQSYIVVTAHYVQNGVLKQRLLGLRARESGEINTNQIIFNKTKQILEDFDCNLSGKSTIVLDPAFDFLDTSQDVQNLPCLSQLLSNVIIKSVKEVPEVVEISNACSNLVDFLMKMEQETLLDGLLNNSYCNRWLKTFKMLNWIEENWCDIEEVLKNFNEKSKILTISIYRLRAVLKTLQPFEEAIEAFEDDTSSTLHLVIVYLHELKKSCDTSESEFQDFDFIQDLKEKLRFNIQKIMSEDIRTLHKIALFLYPPTNKLLQFSDTEKRLIEEECKRLMKNYKQENEPTLKPKLEPGSSAKKTKNLFSDFIVSKPNQGSCELFSREIQLYKSFHAAYSEDFDVFNWWQLHQDDFPYLNKLSCTVLATPATCATSKRFLSNGINLLTKKSTQITKEMELRKIMFINCNAEQDELVMI